VIAAKRNNFPLPESLRLTATIRNLALAAVTLGMSRRFPDLMLPGSSARVTSRQVV
jgi:hypothetical protein